MAVNFRVINNYLSRKPTKVVSGEIVPTKEEREAKIRKEIRENIDELNKLLDPRAVVIITNLIELEIKKYLNAYGIDSF